MTSILKSLDRAINFPFNKYLKSKFSESVFNENKKKEYLDESRIRFC